MHEDRRRHGASTGIGWGCVKVLIGKASGSSAVCASRPTLIGFGRIRRQFHATDLRCDRSGRSAQRRTDRREGAGQGDALRPCQQCGHRGAGPLLYLAIDEFRQQLEVNIIGQLIVTQAFASLLGADRSRRGKPGRIVMMSSIGGKNAFPFVGPYAASKFGLEGMSESLRRELMIFGIDVVMIRPGSVATPIWDKADEVDVTQYANTAYQEPLKKIKEVMITRGHKGYPPERIGRAVHKALTIARPRTAYAENPEKLQGLAVAILPKRTLDRAVAGQLGLIRKD